MAWAQPSKQPNPPSVGPNQAANNQVYVHPAGQSLQARASALVAQGFKLKKVSLPARKKPAPQASSKPRPVKGQPAPFDEP